MKHLEPVDSSSPEFGEFYDELPLWSAPFGQMLLERVPLRPGMAVLDVGCGTGFLTIELAQRCGAQATIIAVDPLKTVMDRLRRKLEHLGITHVRLVEEDAAALDLPPGSIDVIVSNLGINNFDNVDAVLGTCFRAAKPGGRILLTSNLVGHMREFYEVYGATLLELGFAGRLAALDADIRHRATPESLRDQLSRAGFERLDVTTGSFRMRYADGSSFLRHYFIRLGFLQAWKAIAPSDAVAKTFTALERNLDALAAERGELSLTIPMACAEGRKPGGTAG